MTHTEIGRRRRRMKMTQAGFAALIGVAPNTVARWERGELGIKQTTARLIVLLTEGVIQSGRQRAVTRRRP